MADLREEVARAMATAMWGPDAASVYFDMTKNDVRYHGSMAAADAAIAIVVEACCKRAIGEIGATVLHEKATAWLGWSSVPPEKALFRLAERVDGALRALPAPQAHGSADRG